MYPILFRIGPRIIYSYTVALATGMILGLWTAYRFARVRPGSPQLVLDGGFWALLGGILGGRVGYVLANWAFYVDHLDRALSLAEGGLSWHGALIGGGTATAIWLIIVNRPKSSQEERNVGRRVDWRDLLDVAAPGLAAGSAFGWLGCLLTGCGYGTDASGYGPVVSWLAADLPDIYGVTRARFATQPLMIGWSLLLWGTLGTLWRRLPRGGPFALYLMSYALADFGSAFLRGDNAWRWGLWLSQWVDLVAMGIALLLGLLAWLNRERPALSC
jgi:phosphatidylglycerol:prolipoprotein diacylglycerol transferase